MQKLYDRNIKGYRNLIAPIKLKEKYPLSSGAKETVLKAREDIEKILDREDNRMLIILGPCSIHNTQEAYSYAARVKYLSERVKDKFLLVMRTYFEKPRSGIGWPGLLESPNFKEFDEANQGLEFARKLLIDIAELGVPTATEFVNVVTPQFMDDLISYAAVGARSSEVTPLRKMASGLSMPAGIKNNTSGRVEVAVKGLDVVKSCNSYIGIDQYGMVSIVDTEGNPYGHVILRGGNKKPNYDQESVNSAQELIKNANHPIRLVIDCSHGNSRKDYRKQPEVFYNVMEQRRNGDDNIMGVMFESYFLKGNQPILEDPSKLEFGTSVTDACMPLDITEQIILDAYRR